jgi:hypothetical protein
MPRYNWRYPLGRLVCASFAAFFWAFLRTASPDVPLGREPFICNGDLRDHAFVFAQLAGAAIFIELLSWAFWLLSEKRKAPPMQTGIDDLRKFKLGGGELLGLEGSLYSLAFSVALIVFSGRVIGIPDPCPAMNPFSWRHLMGAVVGMYGIMGGINYLIEKVDRPSDKLPV